jgi:hypothetical protein
MIKGGGAGGNRTRDLLNAIQALSQLSYGPTGARILTRHVEPVKARGRVAMSSERREHSPDRATAWYAPALAGVVELVYAGDSKSPGRKAVRVQIPPPAPPSSRLLHRFGT